MLVQSSYLSAKEILMRRVTGVLMHPRATMDEVVRHPAFITTWVVVLLAVAVCGGLLLSTQVGRQALVDERVRVTEALGRAWMTPSTRACRRIRRSRSI